MTIDSQDLFLCLAVTAMAITTLTLLQTTKHN